MVFVIVLACPFVARALRTTLVHVRVARKLLLKERGIRQEDFAKLMGVSRQTISSLETGRYNPSIFLAHKIAQFFGMTIEEVFLFDEEGA